MRIAVLNPSWAEKGTNIYVMDDSSGLTHTMAIRAIRPHWRWFDSFVASGGSGRIHNQSSVRAPDCGVATKFALLPLLIDFEV